MTQEVVGNVTLDGDIWYRARFDRSVRWNGFLCPRFERSEVDRIVSDFLSEDLESSGLATWEGDVLVMRKDYGIGYGIEVERVEPDSDGLYSVGAFAWVWSE